MECSSSNCLFQNRRQKPGEDLPTLAADVEKLATLAYPESKYEVGNSVGRIIFDEISQSDWRNREHQDDDIQAI